MAGYRGIVPPHILDKIVERGTPGQRVLALKNLEISALLCDGRLTEHRIAGIVQPSAPVVKQRMVYDAEQGSTLPGRLVRREGDPVTNDLAVDEAYDGAGYTFDLFKEAYNRNSIDNAGMRLDSSVHYQKGYDNAFWDGAQMVYGDGDEDQPADERIFNRFTICLEVIGHELSHGVIQYSAGLVYANQSGALNESFADVFGALVKQRSLGQTAGEADWLIGKGLFSPLMQAQAIRSMKAPGTAYDDPVLGKDPQPAHMEDYVHTADDDGGVHINSGIPNHAFYLAAIEMGGFAWEKAGRIWYAALTERIRPATTFQEAADMITAVAGVIYGAEGAEQQAVRNAWSAVGLTPGGAEQPQGCLKGLAGLFGIK